MLRVVRVEVPEKGHSVFTPLVLSCGCPAWSRGKLVEATLLLQGVPSRVSPWPFSGPLLVCPAGVRTVSLVSSFWSGSGGS
jgi:hypothetical protein